MSSLVVSITLAKMQKHRIKANKNSKNNMLRSILGFYYHMNANSILTNGSSKCCESNTPCLIISSSRCPSRGRPGTLKTPSYLWFWYTAAGLYLETGHLSSHYIAEILLNMTLSHNQPTNQHFTCVYFRMLLYEGITEVSNLYYLLARTMQKWQGIYFHSLSDKYATSL